MADLVQRRFARQPVWPTAAVLAGVPLAEDRHVAGLPALRVTVCPRRWSSSAARAHAVGVSVLTPTEILIAARRLAGARPHLAAIAGIVHHEDLWQLCRDELTGRVDIRIDGWDIRGRWFGVVVSSAVGFAC